MAPTLLKALAAAAGLYASLAAAAPLQKRVIVWETVTDVVVQTVEVTMTVSGAPGAPQTIPPPEITPPANPPAQLPPTTLAKAPAPPSYAPPPPPPPSPPPAPTSSAPVQPGEFAPKVSSTPPPPPPPATTQAPPPPPPAPTTSQAPAAPSPPPPPPPPAQKPQVQPPSPPSNGPSGQSYSGDMTFYDGGLGACGGNVDSHGEDAVAISVDLMGEGNNHSPYCGKTITIKYNGKTCKAVIKDKCMGCSGGSIDMTRHLFNQL
ncbi:hypothetical protein PRK78_000903 [Emydomyces testavorans]|uniref:Uncharacterized protein n=1 Tax=Emydomyces testavorans TaxID=2070801 RepID=A0AAF0DBH7_9EURO|nr:hypothetical protein PRK78_000903 [Emydomyces testavorans]